MSDDPNDDFISVNFEAGWASFVGKTRDRMYAPLRSADPSETEDAAAQTDGLASGLSPAVARHLRRIQRSRTVPTAVSSPPPQSKKIEKLSTDAVVERAPADTRQSPVAEVGETLEDPALVSELPSAQHRRGDHDDRGDDDNDAAVRDELSREWQDFSAPAVLGLLPPLDTDAARRSRRLGRIRTTKGQALLMEPTNVDPQSFFSGATGTEGLPLTEGIEQFLTVWSQLSRLEQRVAGDRLGLISREQAAAQLDKVSYLAMESVAEHSAKSAALRSRVTSLSARVIELEAVVAAHDSDAEGADGGKNEEFTKASVEPSDRGGVTGSAAVGAGGGGAASAGVASAEPFAAPTVPVLDPAIAEAADEGADAADIAESELESVSDVTAPPALPSVIEPTAVEEFSIEELAAQAAAEAAALDRADDDDASGTDIDTDTDTGDEGHAAVDDGVDALVDDDEIAAAELVAAEEAAALAVSSEHEL